MMKKIFIIALLLLNLLPYIHNGSMMIGFSTISAQTMGNEYNPYDCDDDEYGAYLSPFPCDEEPNICPCLFPDCDFSGPCEEMQEHEQEAHSNSPEEPNDDDNDGWEGGGSGGIGGGAGNNGNGSGTLQNYQPYEIKYGDIVVDNVDNCWRIQPSKKSCVPTAMEYAAQILNNTQDEYLRKFLDDYKSYIVYGWKIEDSGVIPTTITSFINLEFDNDQVYSQTAINSNLDNSKPIITTIPSEPDTYWGTLTHEILIIGHTADNNNYIYLDPVDLETKTVNYNTILGPNFALISLKNSHQ